MVTLILLLLNSSNQGLSLQISKSIKEQCPGADFCRLLSLLNMEIHSQDIAIKVVSTTVNSSDRPTWLAHLSKKKIFYQKISYTFLNFLYRRYRYEILHQHTPTCLLLGNIKYFGIIKHKLCWCSQICPKVGKIAILTRKFFFRQKLFLGVWWYLQQTIHGLCHHNCGGLTINVPYLNSLKA